MALVSLVTAAAFRSDEASTLQPVFKTLWVHVTYEHVRDGRVCRGIRRGVMYLIQDGLLKVQAVQRPLRETSCARLS